MSETVSVVKALTKAQARKLTVKITETAEHLWELLLEAHDRKAWVALGYKSFAAYAEAELAMSDRNAFRLLGQGTVIRELEAAAELPRASVATVSARAAEDIQADLPEVVEKVRAATKDVPEADRPKVVTEVVKEHRESLGKLSAGRGDTQVPEVQPTPEEGRGDSPRADGTASPRGAQPPDPPIPPKEEPVRSFMAHQPTTRDDYVLLIALVDTAGADILAYNVERAALISVNRKIVEAVGMIDNAAGKKQPPKKPAEPKKVSSRASDISVSDCRHPVGSRIDDMCCQCGATVGKLKR